MKRFFTIVALVASVALSSVSCKIVECDCDKNAGTQWQINNYVIKSANWELCTDGNGINPFYRAQLNVPELSKFIWTNGAVMAYLVNSDGGQQPMPCVRHYETYDNGNQIIWTETIDVEFQQGKCFVYATYSDFFVENNPGDVSVRIVLVW